MLMINPKKFKDVSLMMSRFRMRCIILSEALVKHVDGSNLLM